MLSIASGVACAKNEGLRAVGGPVGFVVELRCVPDDLWGLSVQEVIGGLSKERERGIEYLKHDLRDMDGVS
jgi:hypothetical protein